MNYQELTEHLMKHRRLLLRGKYTSDTQDVLSTALLLLDLEGQEPIRLDIDSAGGDANPARYLGDVIRSLQSPVHGCVVGAAYSSAFVILQACDLRLAFPNARLMFHSTSTEVETDHPDTAHRLAHARRLNELNLTELSKRSGQPLSRLRRWSGMGRFFRAEEALELGFIDRIEYPQPKR